MVAAAVVGTVASVGASAMASKSAAKSQQKAADTAAQAQMEAARLADETQRYFYDTARADNMPTMQRGNAAGNQLAMLLGLDVPAYSISTQGGGMSSGIGGSGGNSLAGQQYVDMVGGIPAPNADLYATNDAYREAWNKLAAKHQQMYGTGYTRASDAGVIQRDMTDELRPYLQQQQAAEDARLAEQQATNRTNPLFGSLNKQFTEQDFWNDPGTKLGFQFGLDEGTKGLNRQAAAAGGLNSGATLKALTRYATDYTGTKYGESWNRDQAFKNNQFNRLASLAGVGQTATNTVGGAGQNAANQITASDALAGQRVGNAAIASGNARANSAINMGNSFNSALGFGANALMNYGGFGGGSGYGYSGPGSLFGGTGSNPVTGLAGGAEYSMGTNWGFGA